MKTVTYLKASFLTVIMLLTISFMMSYKNKTDENVKVATIYTYNSADKSEGDFAKTANWMSVSIAPGCAPTGDRPCNITVPAGSSLAAEIGGLTNAQVLAIHPNQRKP